MSENTKKVSKVEYLYGKSNILKIDKVPEKLIKQRIKILNEHLSEMLDVHYTKRDTNRINAVLKAISFWKNINKQ